MSTNSLSDLNVVIEKEDCLDKIGEKEFTNSLSGRKEHFKNEGSVEIESNVTIQSFTNSSQDVQNVLRRKTLWSRLE